VIILCYHAASERWPSVGAVTPEALDRQLRYLLQRGYRPRTLSDALNDSAGQKTVVVTFDDAFCSVLTQALAVLEALAVPGTLFVPTDFAAEGAPMTWSMLGKWVGTEHESELRCMSWEEIRRLAAAGWEVGSHTCSHPNLTAIDGEVALGELRRSREACEAALQRPCRSLAYPFGAHNTDVVELAEKAGYELAVTLGNRLLGPLSSDDLLRLPRDGVYRSTSWPHFLLATSSPLRRIRALRPYRGLAARLFPERITPGVQ
jgi:peptidoglycan/xylan/chitin deacetylase (PgdA/CDA1 family)